MKIQRRPLLVEPPSSAATDIAFILMIFFLVCASVQPGTGREQTIPRSEEEEDPACPSAPSFSISASVWIAKSGGVEGERTESGLPVP